MLGSPVLAEGDDDVWVATNGPGFVATSSATSSETSRSLQPEISADAYATLGWWVFVLVALLGDASRPLLCISNG